MLNDNQYYSYVLFVKFISHFNFMLDKLKSWQDMQYIQLNDSACYLTLSFLLHLVP